jgi:flagellar hook-associated protein 1 FlgK
LYNNFTNSLQTLGARPESIVTRNQVLNEAAVLVQQLNSMSNDVQALRSQAEMSLRAGVERVNQILQQIEQLSSRISAAADHSSEVAALLDARDVLVGELSSFMDIRISEQDRGQISIYTTSGVSLYDHKASQLRFDGHDMIGSQSIWSADADERQVGTIRITSPSGYDTDLIADKAIRSGSIKAHLEMRDETLVQAQAQLDEIAHALASALSDRTVSGSAATDGGQDGYSIDLTELRNGNTISLNYLDGAGQQQRITIVRVDDTGALPLSNNFTSDPNDTVVGVSFANGMAGVVTALNAALGGTGIVFDNPSGFNLRVLDDGGANPGTVQALSAKVTTATFDSGSLSMPFFIDGGTGQLYTNAVTAGGAQKVGFAARIAINPALKANPGYLVQYALGVAAGDPARANFIEQQLTSVSLTFSPATGIGTQSGPYSGSLADFIRQAVSMQGAAAENASRLNDGQEIVLNALQARFAERSSVNVDSEMANLLVLQTAYGANARVLSAVKEMIDALMRI